MRTIIIGDIHGCSGALRLLLAKIMPNPEEDKLIFLGDLFDRGPDSWQVLRQVKGLAEAFGDQFVLLRGNHEDYLLRDHLTFSERVVWERVGRGATVRSFRRHSEKMEDCAPWLKEHSVLYYKGEDCWCVHAGMMIEPPEANDAYTLMHDHDIVLRNIYAGPLVITGHIALDQPAWFKGDRQTIEKLSEGEWNDLPEYGTICIDAGCGKGGRLIGMIIEGNRYILYGAAETG